MILAVVASILTIWLAVIAEEPPTAPLPPPSSKWQWVPLAVKYRINATGYTIRSYITEYLVHMVSDALSVVEVSVSRWACRSMPDGIVPPEACAFD